MYTASQGFRPPECLAVDHWRARRNALQSLQPQTSDGQVSEQAASKHVLSSRRRARVNGNEFGAFGAALYSLYNHL